MNFNLHLYHITRCVCLKHSHKVCYLTLFENHFGMWYTKMQLDRSMTTKSKWEASTWGPSSKEPKHLDGGASEPPWLYPFPGPRPSVICPSSVVHVDLLASSAAFPHCHWGACSMSLGLAWQSSPYRECSVSQPLPDFRSELSLPWCGAAPCVL